MADSPSRSAEAADKRAKAWLQRSDGFCCGWPRCLLNRSGGEVCLAIQIARVVEERQSLVESSRACFQLLLLRSRGFPRLFEGDGLVVTVIDAEKDGQGTIEIVDSGLRLAQPYRRRRCCAGRWLRSSWSPLFLGRWGKAWLRTSRAFSCGRR